MRVTAALGVDEPHPPPTPNPPVVGPADQGRLLVDANEDLAVDQRGLEPLHDPGEQALHAVEVGEDYQPADESQPGAGPASRQVVGHLGEGGRPGRAASQGSPAVPRGHDGLENGRVPQGIGQVTGTAPGEVDEPGPSQTVSKVGPFGAGPVEHKYRDRFDAEPPGVLAPQAKPVLDPPRPLLGGRGGQERQHGRPPGQQFPVHLLHDRKKLAAAHQGNWGARHCHASVEPP